MFCFSKNYKNQHQNRLQKIENRLQQNKSFEDNDIRKNINLRKQYNLLRENHPYSDKLKDFCQINIQKSYLKKQINVKAQTLYKQRKENMLKNINTGKKKQKCEKSKFKHKFDFEEIQRQIKSIDLLKNRYFNMEKTPIKTIHVKLKKSNSNINLVRTPIANISLTDRNNPMISPTFSTQSTQRKILSMQIKNNGQNIKKKKSVKIIKKKGQSLDFLHNKNSKKQITRSSSQRKFTKKDSINSFRQEKKMNIFQQTTSILDLSKTQTFRDWNHIIENKKKQLYAQLYKLDKKLLTQDQNYHKPTDTQNGKKQMMDLIRKKCSTRINTDRKQLQPVQLNIYKVNRMIM